MPVLLGTIPARHGCAMIDPAEVARLRELEARATPGLWALRCCNRHVAEGKRVTGCLSIREPSGMQIAGESDLLLAAAARNALPALLDAADAAEVLRAGREALRKHLEAVYACKSEAPDTCVSCARHKRASIDLIPELAPLWNQAEEASELARENERLRGLLGEALPHLWHSACPRELYERTEREAGK